MPSFDIVSEVNEVELLARVRQDYDRFVAVVTKLVEQIRGTVTVSVDHGTIWSIRFSAA